MPTNYIKSLSEKHKIGIKQLETLWEIAKNSSKNKNNFGLITNIFKNMINKKFNLNESKKEVDLFLTEKKMYLEENELPKEIEDQAYKIFHDPKILSSDNSIDNLDDFLEIFKLGFELGKNYKK